jgi:hypothetical protein
MSRHWCPDIGEEDGNEQEQEGKAPSAGIAGLTSTVLVQVTCVEGLIDGLSTGGNPRRGIIVIGLRRRIDRCWIDFSGLYQTLLC